MKAALTQMNPVWESPEENRQICRRLTEEAHLAGADWIFFPEMTLTGFTMRPTAFQEAEDDTSPVNQFFLSLSATYAMGIGYGTIAADGRNGELRARNQLRLVWRGRTILSYDKLHPFTYGEEARHYAGGDHIAVAPLPDADAFLSGFICYDLRFPEVFQLASEQASVIVVIANWPTARIAHWQTLLQARAIENQCFILGINRTGEGGGISYSPSSTAYDPCGERLTPVSGAELLYADIRPELAAQYRASFPLKQDRRPDFYRTPRIVHL